MGTIAVIAGLLPYGNRSCECEVCDITVTVNNLSSPTEILPLIKLSNVTPNNNQMTAIYQ